MLVFSGSDQCYSRIEVKKGFVKEPWGSLEREVTIWQMDRGEGTIDREIV